MVRLVFLMVVVSSTMGAKEQDLVLDNTRDQPSPAKEKDSSVTDEGMRDSPEQFPEESNLLGPGDAVPLKAKQGEQAFSPTEKSPVRDREAKLLQEAGFKNAQGELKAGAEHKQEARPTRPEAAVTDAKFGVDDREAKLLQEAGFKNAQGELKAGAEHKQEAHPSLPPADDRETKLLKEAAQEALPEHKKPEQRPSFFEMIARLHAPDVAGTHEVPKYISLLPISIKFVDVGDKSVLVFADNENLAFTVPPNLVYIYPLVLLPTYTLLWCLCCMRAKRQGLTFGLVLESATCFMCLWADLATKHRVLSRGRAWSFVVIMFVLMCGWHVAALVAKEKKWDDTVIFWTFGTLVTLVWFMFAIERMFVRKFYRRSFDPMSTDHYGEDCCMSLVCGQLAALQEAQMMSNAGQQQGQLKADGRW